MPVDDEPATFPDAATDAPTAQGPSTNVPTAGDRPGARAVTLASRSGERYRLGSEIGRGGMGEIIGATDEQIGREVVVKRMKERNPTERAMGRFFREACIQGRLDHPAIVPVHELGVDADGRPFFTMKRLAGTTLDELIAKDHPRQRLLGAFADVCLAIEFAHARGVVHRDLKPHNIVLGDFGEVYVLDWGVAKVLGEFEDPSPLTIESLGSAEARSVAEGQRGASIDGGATPDPITVDGSVIGTAGYYAPEQALGHRDIDGRVDVYALGCVLFEILAGEPLHPRGDAGRSSVLRGADARASIRAPGRDIPPELDALCVAATELDRDERIATPRELGERVQRYLDGDRDLALRQQLAREHLDAARAAFARAEDESERGTAMREAGRALALDPKLAGAAQLVTRLMLEPPRVMPPAVVELIRAGNMETLRRQSRAGAFGYLAFFALLPILIAGGREQVVYVVALALLIGVNVVILLGEVNLSGWRGLRIAIANASMLGFLAHMTSPFLVAPAVAALVTMALVFSPTYTRGSAAALLATAMILALLLPWVAELTGLVTPTMTVDRDTFVFHPAAFRLAPVAKQMFFVLFTCAVIIAGCGLGFANRRAERDVRNRLHLQAWQLAQLVDAS